MPRITGIILKKEETLVDIEGSDIIERENLRIDNQGKEIAALRRKTNEEWLQRQGRNVSAKKTAARKQRLENLTKIAGSERRSVYDLIGCNL